MNLGFQDQFVMFVENGTKTHTIRGGHRWKVGMRADLFAESRRRKVFANVRIDGDTDCVCLEQDAAKHRPCRAHVHSRFERQQIAGMRLLFRVYARKVEPIEIAIRENMPRLTIDGQRLDLDEANAFFWRDGFRNLGPCPKLQGALWQRFPYLSQAMGFWVRVHKLVAKPFYGQVIHWDYTQRFLEKPRKPRAAVTRAEAMEWGERFEKMERVQP